MINFSKLKLAFLTSAALMSAPSFAQDEIADLLVGSKDDANLLTKAYLDPFFKGVGTGLNSGWTNTGSVKKLGRFEFRVGVTGALAPTSARSFDVNKLGLTTLRLAQGETNSIAPTIVGEDIQGPTLQLYREDGTQVSGATVQLPQGLNPPKGAVPAPQLQATVGLIKGFEAIVRYTPAIDIGSDYGTIQMVGGGLKFQPLRLISKKLNKALPFDLAMAIGYNSLKYSYDLEKLPPADATYENGNYSESDFKNQKVDIKFSGINVEAIASKKLFMLTPFVSVGYMTSKTDGGLRGNYAIQTDYDGSKPIYSVINNPVAINEKHINNLRASAGFQLNLFLLHIYGSYNVASYNYVNVGLGIGFGK